MTVQVALGARVAGQVLLAMANPAARALASSVAVNWVRGVMLPMLFTVTGMGADVSRTPVTGKAR